VLLPHASASVRSARRRLAADLSRRGVPRRAIEDAVLVVSEIVSNALKHARPLNSGKVQVAWDVTPGTVEIAVTDGGGPTRPYVQMPSLSSLGGRGLGIVAAIAGDWGVEQTSDGTTVWAVLPVDRHVRPMRSTDRVHR
jgi:anti-sigma regulatory factor (Ser/Thr protein kinase)